MAFLARVRRLLTTTRLLTLTGTGGAGKTLLAIEPVSGMPAGLVDGDALLEAAQTRAALGDEAFDAAWQSGGFLTLDEAVSEATQARRAH